MQSGNTFPNWWLCAHMLRTKLYQNQSFSTVHEIKKKTKSRVVKTAFGSTILIFYVTIIGLFASPCKDVNMLRSNCALIGCNPSRPELGCKTQNYSQTCPQWTPAVPKKSIHYNQLSAIQNFGFFGGKRQHKTTQRIYFI